MSLYTSLSNADIVCPYCGRASLVVGATDFGDGHLAEGICSVCGTRTRCYSAPQEGVRLPWLIAVEAFA
jgi:transcription elongation factor Elf1